MDEITLDQAIDHLYQTAVVEGSTTSTRRLKVLADYCVYELRKRGIPEAETEVTLPGGGRDKNWDVAWQLDDKYRLAISLKSILTNLGGTVPNRIDDLMGEVTNLQMYSPEVVIGYLMVFNKTEDTRSQKHGSTWGDLLRSRLQGLSGRRAPFWSIGMIESFVLVEVDFLQGPRILTPAEEADKMFNVLVSELISRNPSIHRAKGER